MIALAQIFRHPIKAHGFEEVAETALSVDQVLPMDRVWAVTHELSKFDPAAPAWVPCANFQRGCRTLALMAMRAEWDGAQLTLTHPELPPLTFDPETEGARFIDWVKPISPTDRFVPKALVRGPVAMTDNGWPGIAIANLASNAALGAHLGRSLHPARWRANLWLEGAEPWAERGWLGRELRLGEAVLRVEEPLYRCKATTASPETGREDADTLGALRALHGEEAFAVLARVISPGRIALGDRVEVL